MNLTSTVLRPRRARPAAVAILYPKVGNVLRVPLRRTAPSGPNGCEQHPERQFIVWFNRMTAARPGFPLQIKSILLITGQPLCPSCHRALATYLSRYYLADKLRLRTSGQAGCGCADRCGCASRRSNVNFSPRQVLSTLLLNQLLADADASLELEEEGWWRKLKNLGQAAVVAGATLFPSTVPIKPVVDMISSAAEAEKKRRDTQQVVDDNTPPSSRRAAQRRELENPFLANPFSREFELDEEQKKALRQLVARFADGLRQPLYESKTKPGRSGDPVKAQVNRNAGAELIRIANNVNTQPGLLAQASALGVDAVELAAALKAHGKWLIGKSSQARHKELAVF